MHSLDSEKSHSKVLQFLPFLPLTEGYPSWPGSVSSGQPASVSIFRLFALGLWAGIVVRGGSR